MGQLNDHIAVVVIPIVHRADGCVWTIITEEARATLQSTVFGKSQADLRRKAGLTNVAGFAAGLIEVRHRLEALTEEAQQTWPELTEHERAAAIAALQETREELGLCMPEDEVVVDPTVASCSSITVKAVEGPDYIDPG